ncbi:MAG TPA: energy transducer TonB [Pyrinomonadaceae bacterium]|jgi:TonB family protein
MLKSRTALVSLPTVLLFCACLLIIGTRSQAFAQQYNRPAAQEYYEAGLKLLKEESYRKALEQAESAFQVDRDFAPAWLLKSNALVGLFKQEYKKNSGPNKNNQKAFLRLKEAADSLGRYIRLVPAAPDAEAMREAYSALLIYGQLAEADEPSRTLFRPAEVDTKARIRHRPMPSMPEKAREAGAQGAVVLLGVLDKDGTIRHLMVIEPMGYGLTEACLEAARRTEFTPAIKNGQPVSTLLQMEYNFNLY